LGRLRPFLMHSRVPPSDLVRWGSRQAFVSLLSARPYRDDNTVALQTLRRMHIGPQVGFLRPAAAHPARTRARSGRAEPRRLLGGAGEFVDAAARRRAEKVLTAYAAGLRFARAARSRAPRLRRGSRGGHRDQRALLEEGEDLPRRLLGALAL